MGLFAVHFSSVSQTQPRQHTEPLLRCPKIESSSVAPSRWKDRQLLPVNSSQLLIFPLHSELLHSQVVREDWVEKEESQNKSSVTKLHS